MSDNNYKKALKITLFGKPKILIEKEEIYFPYKKSEGLLYYLIVNKISNRDYLGNLFWGNINDEILIKKNLRNAIYIIRKIFGKDFILSKGKDIIEINSSYLGDTDLNRFLNTQNYQILNFYKGDFLQGFNIKDSSQFEEWVEFKRQEYKDIFADKLIKVIEEYIEREEYFSAKKYCKILIKKDEFDERAYRLLIEIYKRQGAYSKCMSLYQQLEALLHNELLISPDKTTEVLINEVKVMRDKEIEEVKLKKNRQSIKEKKEKNVKEKGCNGGNIFYGREEELNKMILNYRNFHNKNWSKSILLMGEEGIGKSKTVDEFLIKINNTSKEYKLFTQCYRAEEQYIFKPWYKIFEQISKIIRIENIKIPRKITNIITSIFPDFNIEENIPSTHYIEKFDFIKYQAIERAIIDLLDIISCKKRIIIYIDDFQWADDISISLVRNIMINDKNKSIFFIIACRTVYRKKVESFLLEMYKYEVIDKIFLERFNNRETIEFVKKVLPDYKLPAKFKKMIYKETEGNPLFLVEVLNNIKENRDLKDIPPKIQDILKNRIMAISTKGKKILDIISIFFDKVSFEMLEKISLIDGFELVDIIDELCKKNLILEKGSLEEFHYVFNHQKVRDYVYATMSLSKKRVLHNRAAEVLEECLKNNKRDVLLYSKLIYHFERCGKKYKALKYNIKYLYEYLQLKQESFPLLYFSNGEKQLVLKNSYTHEQVQNDLKKMEELINEVKENNSTDENINLISQYLHMMGRFYIRQGEYEKGLKYINDLIDIGIKYNSTMDEIRGYRQLMCYYINTYKTNEMDETIQKALEKVKKFNCLEEIAIWWRLEGLLKIMEGKFKEGEDLLQKSIDVFMASEEKEKYLSNLAASYNWIGESKRHRQDYNGALKYYEKAINVYEKKGLVEGLSVFNTNAGQAAYDARYYEKAEKYLSAAISCFDQIDALWLRSLAHSYYALLLFHKEEFKLSIVHLKKAYRFAKKLKSPYEIGVVYRIMAKIRYEINKNIKANEVFKDYLSKPLSYYCNKALEYLKYVESPIDSNILKELEEYA
ncbi:AAA family ATPase [Maledivibacter halophilus]|uniref:Predicted ATPase n=1 Tax=Maledivibacter halophilus TaxID=36842 RepID=A0A1T5M5N3_9FIRM|nr:AAA family ATPase [Maledivibacter halophilus]SKC83179.1 Predicted ATPase [Maledivibacter halophilus]